MLKQDNSSKSVLGNAVLRVNGAMQQRFAKGQYLGGVTPPRAGNGLQQGAKKQPDGDVLQIVGGAVGEEEADDESHWGADRVFPVGNRKQNRVKAEKEQAGRAWPAARCTATTAREKRDRYQGVSTWEPIDMVETIRPSNHCDGNRDQ
jgi:hypothetical protein